ncbi:MAG: HD domain-containing phosphohydrolase [Myxococcota bacterium]
MSFFQAAVPLSESVARLLAKQRAEPSFEDVLEAFRKELDVLAVGWYRRNRGSYELVVGIQPEPEPEDGGPKEVPAGRFFARRDPPPMHEENDQHPLIDGDAELRLQLPGSDDYLGLNLVGAVARPHLVTPFAGGLLVIGSFTSRALAKKAKQRWDESAATLQVLGKSALDRAEHQSEVTRLEGRLRTANRTIASALDMSSLFKALLSVAARASRHQGAFIGRRDGDAFVLRTHYGLDDIVGDLVGERIDGALFDLEMVMDEPIIVPKDVTELTELGVDSLLAFPILNDGELAGVLGLVNSKRKAGVQDGDYGLLASFTEQISRVMARELEVVAFGNTYFDTLQALCRALDLARGCEGHHERVSQLAADMAGADGLDERSVDLLRRAGLVHDVGLVQAAGGSRDVQTEFGHPTLGALLAGPLRDGADLAALIREHHETDDGFGFPDALKQDALAPLGRYLALAEYIVERMTGNQISEGLDADAMRAELLRSDARFSKELREVAAKQLRSLKVA